MLDDCERRDPSGVAGFDSDVEEEGKADVVFDFCWHKWPFGFLLWLDLIIDIIAILSIFLFDLSFS